MNASQPEATKPVARSSFRSHLARMTTVDEIKLAIKKLSLKERAEIAAEICGWTDDDWDRQMKADAASGKFEDLSSRTEDVGITSG